MKDKKPHILILSSYDIGGASIAAIRLHKALLAAGENSRLLTLHKSHSDLPAHFQYHPGASLSNRLGLKIRQRAEHHQKRALHLPAGESLAGEYSLPIASYDVTDSPHWEWADVINLHWVNEWVSVENLVSKSGNKKLIWTMHDMHVFTGGCHYSYDCNEFTRECRTCPFLVRSSIPQLAHQSWKSKKTALTINQPNLSILAPSQWMVDKARKSSLLGEFPGQVLYNSLDTDVFKPLPRDMSCDVLGLPRNKKILLCVIQSLQDRRKGFAILTEALGHLADPDEWLLCTVGKWHQGPVESALEHRHLGTISDERLMAVVYNAATIFVHPATEDNLPNVVAEALCCGIPVAGFFIGGMPEMVTSGTNGFLSAEKTAASLAQSVGAVKNAGFSQKSIAERAHRQFSPANQAKRFMEIVLS